MDGESSEAGTVLTTSAGTQKEPAGERLQRAGTSAEQHVKHSKSQRPH